MSKTQSTTKMFAVRTFATLAAMSVLLAPLAFAADQTMSGTVATVNTFSVTGGATVSLAPTVDVVAVDSSTALAFDTNDGITYKITVVAAVGGWVFTPASGAATSTTAYPELSFASATATAGTASVASGVLINAGNTVSGAVDVVTAITSMAGTATVTLNASITQTVVAGSYATTLTYAITLP